MDAAKNKYSPTLRGQRIDDCFYLPQCFARMQLRFDIAFVLEQFQVCDGFETDHLVPAGGVDDEVAGDGEQIGSARRHIFPIFRGVGTGEDFGHHVVKFMGGGKYPP